MCSDEARSVPTSVPSSDSSVSVFLLGVGFLGAALEPTLTRRFGATVWNTLSAGKQTVALFVMAITAVVLYGVVSGFGSLVSAMVA